VEEVKYMAHPFEKYLATSGPGIGGGFIRSEGDACFDIEGIHNGRRTDWRDNIAAWVEKYGEGDGVIEYGESNSSGWAITEKGFRICRNGYIRRLDVNEL
jgi:hypothetical protein